MKWSIGKRPKMKMRNTVFPRLDCFDPIRSALRMCCCPIWRRIGHQMTTTKSGTQCLQRMLSKSSRERVRWLHQRTTTTLNGTRRRTHCEFLCREQRPQDQWLRPIPQSLTTTQCLDRRQFGAIFVGPAFNGIYDQNGRSVSRCDALWPMAMTECMAAIHPPADHQGEGTADSSARRLALF